MFILYKYIVFSDTYYYTGFFHRVALFLHFSFCIKNLFFCGGEQTSRNQVASKHQSRLASALRSKNQACRIRLFSRGPSYRRLDEREPSQIVVVTHCQNLLSHINSKQSQSPNEKKKKKTTHVRVVFCACEIEVALVSVKTCFCT